MIFSHHLPPFQSSPIQSLLSIHIVDFCVTVASAKSLQSWPTLRDPIDSSPPGTSVPGILEARILEWVAISFSNARQWKVKVKSLSHVWLLATPWTAAYQAPHPWDFPGKSTGVGCHFLLHDFYVTENVEIEFCLHLEQVLICKHFLRLSFYLLYGCFVVSVSFSSVSACPCKLVVFHLGIPRFPFSIFCESNLGFYFIVIKRLTKNIFFNKTVHFKLTSI